LESDNAAVDIERIKHWITYNTEVMLRRRQIEEEVEVHRDA
jgi:hypothetical protein